MVAISDNGHDHDGDEVCPRCQFVERLGDFLDEAAQGEPDEWHGVTGEVVEYMHSALWALHRLRAESTTDYTDQIDNVGEAARAIVALGEKITQFRSVLCTD